MTRTQRVWLIIRALKEGSWTVEALAERFDVSERTIRDDLLLIRTEPFYQNVQRRMVHSIEPVCQ